MAIATSLKSSDKNALLEKINVLIWVLNHLKEAGAFPSNEALDLKYPNLSREKLLFYLGCKSEDEVIDKLTELKLKFEGLQQTLALETNTPEEIKKVPAEVLQSGAFVGKEETEIGKSIQSFLSQLQKEPTDEDLRLIEPAERKAIQATLVDPHAPFSPTYNQAAEVLAQAGLIDEYGDPQPQYRNLISNPEFKAEIEKRIRKALLTQDFETQIIASLDEKFASLDIPQETKETISKEFNFIKKQIAAPYAQLALSQFSNAGNDVVSISAASQATKKIIAAKIKKDKEFLPRFLDSILVTNLKLEKDEALRKEIVEKLTNATFEALGAFSPNQNVWVSLGEDLPRVAYASYFLDEKGNLKHDLHDYWALPKTPEAQSEEFEEEKNDQEVFLAALYKATSTMPNPNIGKYIGTERPDPKKLWPYYVSAPLFAGWFITDPSEAISAIPYGATAIATYIGTGKIKEKVKTFKKKLQPFLNPGEYLRQRYSEAVQRLLFQKIPATALRMTPLFKNYQIKGPDGNIYQYAEFRPARFLRTQTGKILGKFAGEKTDSIRHRVFSRAKENITPKVNPQKRKVEKKHNGLLGVIIGVALVDVIFGAIWEFVKDRVVMFAKIERALGPAGRIGKSAFSLNTAAGAYAGFLIGAPLGLSGPLMIVGGLSGWGFQAAKDFAKDQGFLVRQAQREQLLAEGRLFSRWERFVTRVGRVPRFLARYPLVENLPLKGVAFGYMVGGVPGAITFGSLQFIWANRSWMGFQVQTAAHEFVWEASGSRYADLGHFFETGVNKWPLWQRVPIKALAEFRYVGRWAPGAGVGGAIGFLASGGNPLGALAGALIGSTAQITTAFLTRTTISFLSSAWEKYVLHNLRMLYARYPWMRFTKGGIAGLGIGLLLTYLGIPVWLALPAGVIAGVGTQWAIERLLARFFGRAGAQTAAEVAEAAGTRAAAGGLRLLIGKIIGGFTGIGTAFAAFDLGRSILKYVDANLAYDPKAHWYSLYPGAGRPYWVYKLEKLFLKGAITVLDIVLWPWDKFWGWFFGPFWSSFLGPFLTKAYLVVYDIGKSLFGWTRNLPGVLGKTARAIGGAFGAVKNAITGGVQTFLSIVMGLLGGFIQLLLGGDVAEAALAAAIGVAIGGSVINSATISSAFVQNPQKAPTSKISPFVELIKTAETKNPDLGPSQTIFLPNEELPHDITFVVKIIAKENLSNLSCTDQLTLTKKDGTTEILPLPLLPPCPSSLKSGEEYSFSFTFTAPNEEKYKDAILKNTFSLNGKAQIEGGAFFIPFRNSNILPFGGNPQAIENFKNHVRNDYQNNLIDVECSSGQTCWDYVINQSIHSGVNPTFILAVWYEESHFSDVGNHFSCPAGTTQLHTAQGLKDSLNCFLNEIVDDRPNTPEQFVDMLHQYCGTGPWSPDQNNPLPLCSNNPNFLDQLKAAYQDLGGTDMTSGGSSTSFSHSVVAVVFIGQPSIETPRGWPTTGTITQGLHAGGAIDIAGKQADPLGDPVYATFNGTVTLFEDDLCGLAITIWSSDSSFHATYCHLSERTVKDNDQVTWRQLIGYQGYSGWTEPDDVPEGTHLHYTFHNSLPMAPPNIPADPEVGFVIDNLDDTNPE